jgi:predicted nucleotidyltransferase
MDERIKHLVNKIKGHLIKTYGKRIKQVILYGSQVRGETTKDSDVDILVVVDESLIPFEVRKNLSDLLFDIILEEGELVSVIVVPEHFFKNYNSPFLLNVRKEGVTA